LGNEDYQCIILNVKCLFSTLAMKTNSKNAMAYLDTAATQGRIDFVNLLLETNARNNGKSICYLAARMSHAVIITLLSSNHPRVGFRRN
jgi:ankyrin repeat protein